MLLLLFGCAARWWQPTQWQGDDTVAVGVLCEGGTIAATSPEPYWVRVSVRWHDDVRVDWGTAQLAAVGAEVVGDELGAVRTAGREQQMRYHTFYLRPAAGAEPGQVLDIGPYTVEWQSNDAAAPRPLTGTPCRPTLQR